MTPPAHRSRDAGSDGHPILSHSYCCVRTQLLSYLTLHSCLHNLSKTPSSSIKKLSQISLYHFAVSRLTAPFDPPIASERLLPLQSKPYSKYGVSHGRSGTTHTNRSLVLESDNSCICTSAASLALSHEISNRKCRRLSLPKGSLLGYEVFRLYLCLYQFTLKPEFFGRIQQQHELIINIVPATSKAVDKRWCCHCSFATTSGCRCCSGCSTSKYVSVRSSIEIVSSTYIAFDLLLSADIAAK